MLINNNDHLDHLDTLDLLDHLDHLDLQDDQDDQGDQEYRGGGLIILPIILKFEPKNRGKNMQLLSGANITILLENDKYIAIVYVGLTSKKVIADDPIKALGLAIMLQAGYTEKRLKDELEKVKP